MLKQETIPIEESNLALFGSSLEYEIKKHAAETEVAFQGCGRTAGLTIWRINKFKLESVPQPCNMFYSGDSYIVLNTRIIGDDKPVLKHDIHFWLGQATTVDEAGTAAYKTVELDEIFDMEPVQHREVQGSESDLFLSYFGGNFTTLEGGYDSGFRHVESTKYTPRLLHISGNRQTQVSEVPLSVSSLDDNDVFVVDTGLTLYQWQGRSCSPMERNRAAQLVRSIDSERGGRATIVVLDQGNETDAFWNSIGGRPSTLQESNTTRSRGIGDWIRKKVELSPNGLWMLNDDNKTFTQVQNADVVPTVDMLDAMHIYVYDNGKQVWVWVGMGAISNSHLRGSTTEQIKQFQRNSMSLAHLYMSQTKRSKRLPISLKLQTPIAPGLPW